MKIKIITRNNRPMAFVDGYNVSAYFKQGPAAIMQAPDHIVQRSKYKSIAKQCETKKGKLLQMRFGWLIIKAKFRRTFNIYGIKKTKEGYYVNISYNIDENRI